MPLTMPPFPFGVCDRRKDLVMLADSPEDGEKFLGEFLGEEGLSQCFVGLLKIRGFYVGHAESVAIYFSPVLL